MIEFGVVNRRSGCGLTTPRGSIGVRLLNSVVPCGLMATGFNSTLLGLSIPLRLLVRRQSTEILARKMTLVAHPVNGERMIDAVVLGLEREE